MYVKQECYILFYRKLKKKNSDGLVPLYVRLTIDGIQDELSTGIWLPAPHWNQKGQSVLPGAADQQSLNDQLAQIRTDLKRHFDLIQVQHEIATPDLVIQAYKTPLRAEKTRQEAVENLALSEALDGLISRYVVYKNRYEQAYDLAIPPHPAKVTLLNQEREGLEKELKAILRRGNRLFDDPHWEKTLILAVNEHLLHFMELSFAGERSANTLEKMWGRKKRYVDFLQYRYETIDLPLKQLHLKIADQLLTYNITQHALIENSAMKYVQYLKEVLTRAVSLGWIPASVLDSYHCHYDETDRKWPTPAELETFRTTEFATDLQNIVRDCYVFGCYTAFAYAELYSFAPDQIIVGIDGKRWAGKHRQKTKVEESLPLLPIVTDLIDKYKTHPKSIRRGRCLPIPNNIVYNRELKKMAKQVGWKIKLDGHTSRYFFINEVAFNNGVTSLKTLAKMVGIKSLKTLMVYLKGNKKAISESMEMVRDKLFYPDGTLKASRASDTGGAKVISLKIAN